MRFGIREMIFLLLLLAIPVGAYFYVFQPANAQIATARKDITAKRAKLQQLEAATRTMADLGREIEKLARAIELFENKLPQEKEVEVILKQVWELASKHTLKPRSIHTDKPQLHPRHAELPLKMIISGDFDGFYRFLLDLERLSRLTQVPRMRLKKLKGDDEGAMEADFTLSIFFEPQPAAM